MLAELYSALSCNADRGTGRGGGGRGSVADERRWDRGGRGDLVFVGGVGLVVVL